MPPLKRMRLMGQFFINFISNTECAGVLHRSAQMRVEPLLQLAVNAFSDT